MSNSKLLGGVAPGVRQALHKPEADRVSDLDEHASRFASRSGLIFEVPVKLPPGLLRLATRRSRTGSPPLLKTIGLVPSTLSLRLLERLQLLPQRPQRDVGEL
jgi:hypothetical protein